MRSYNSRDVIPVTHASTLPDAPHHTQDGVPPPRLHQVSCDVTSSLYCHQVGFPRRDPERLKVALANTHRMIWIRSLKQSRVSRLGQLLGFARATSDGAFSATIW